MVQGALPKKKEKEEGESQNQVLYNIKWVIVTICDIITIGRSDLI